MLGDTFYGIAILLVIIITSLPQVIKVQIRDDIDFQSSSDVTSLPDDLITSPAPPLPALMAVPPPPTATVTRPSHTAFLTSRHLTFPDTAVGHYSGEL